MGNGQIDFQPDPSPGAIDFQPDEAQPTAPSRPQGNVGSIKPQPKTLSKDWWKQKAYDIAVPSAYDLPAAGATAGSVLGATGGTFADPLGGEVAGGIVGAGIGGGTGESLKNAFLKLLYPSYNPSLKQQVSGIAKQGVEQSLLQAGSEALPLLAGPLKKLASDQYLRALAPTKEYNKEIAREIVPGLLERKQIGSLERLGAKAETKAAEVRPELNQQYQQLEKNLPNLPVRNAQTGRMARGPGGQIPNAGTKVIADLELAKNSFKAGGIVADPAGVKALSEVQGIVRQYGQNISPNTLRQLRQVFDVPVSKAGGYAGKDLTTQYALNAREAAANSIRKILNSTPDIGALNKEISFWLDVQKVTGDTLLRKSGQSGGLLKTLTPLGAGTAAGVAGVHFGSAATMEAGAATVLATMGARIATSPQWRTFSAVSKNTLASALARGDVQAVSALAGRFGIALQQESSKQ